MRCASAREQIPGYVINNDLSQFLNERGYYGSYNVAFDPYLRAISGADAAAAKNGPWFEYWESARGQLFARDAPSVHDLSSLQSCVCAFCFLFFLFFVFVLSRCRAAQPLTDFRKSTSALSI